MNNRAGSETQLIDDVHRYILECDRYELGGGQATPPTPNHQPTKGKGEDDDATDCF